LEVGKTCEDRKTPPKKLSLLQKRDQI
jgi:hypothetical protein